MSGSAPRGLPPLITVLGASGFVGAAVTAALARRPVRLRAVSRRPPDVAGAGAASFEVHPADVTDRAALAHAVDGADVVVNLLLNSGGWRAAEEDPRSELVNVGVIRSTADLLRRRRGTGRPPLVVYSGSASQIGVPPDAPIDGGEPDRPETAYDRQKLAAERALKEATAEGVLRGVSLRLPTVYGEPTGSGNADRGVVSTMIGRALAGEPLRMWHDGTVRRDLVHVTDVARAVEAAIDHPDRLVGGHWLIGSGESPALGDAFRLIADSVARHTGRPPVPVLSVPPPDHAPVTDFRSVLIDPWRFRAVTGWKPELSLAEGVDRTVAALTAHAS
ncbi:NAD-dependent epimerase/dehydratase family protein [Streptomyces radicis]|uniref:NAD-dependent epimerase/dehydratase family protein n=1 Tax=Streptomyces radicis TaxID=1750517 RepID=A0A3A9WZA1_9ACTN|nr:NAD-dependent epimerase/dehydratase [Streptomyces radicis]RKN11537.1 NAD-dependent epimerase/dehydratase family protein [Streptomyces radicis]RKN26445.1 NAD-dependent epimerase/dehydratase family protein [Streptomyces radicis]